MAALLLPIRAPVRESESVSVWEALALSRQLVRAGCVAGLGCVDLGCMALERGALVCVGCVSGAL